MYVFSIINFISSDIFCRFNTLRRVLFRLGAWLNCATITDRSLHFSDNSLEVSLDLGYFSSQLLLAFSLKFESSS
jgi:hypothetical protein